jgi:hypothetical protein
MHSWLRSGDCPDLSLLDLRHRWKTLFAAAPKSLRRNFRRGPWPIAGGRGAWWTIVATKRRKSPTRHEMVMRTPRLASRTAWHADDPAMAKHHHTVTALVEGSEWNVYYSHSVANAITGTNWNGSAFFIKPAPS